MGLRSLRSSIAFAVLATLLAFGFQNCGKTLPGFGRIGSPHENPGNGSGYEGMGPVTGGINFPQLRYVLAGTCSDGKNVFSAIVAQGDVYYLQIDSCQA